MTGKSAGFVSIALSSAVFIRAVKVGLVVGTLLALINHGDAIVSLSVDGKNIMKMLLTFLVPYGVSTYSSVRAIQSEQRGSRTD